MMSLFTAAENLLRRGNRHKTPGTKGRFLVCRLTGLRSREVMDFFPLKD